jgi:2-iminobutanoate/2-iminopropanoate deaminase
LYVGFYPVRVVAGKMPASLEEQAHCSMRNLGAILEAAGSCYDQIVKTTIFLQDMNDFGKINDIYKDFFTSDFPARSCVEVARLPKDVLIEIEAIATVE